jgi:hypothetical protein
MDGCMDAIRVCLRVHIEHIDHSISVYVVEVHHVADVVWELLSGD